MDDQLPPLDPDAGLTRYEIDMGNHVLVHVVTAAEALDEHHAHSERDSSALPTFPAEDPDEVHTASDDRPILVYYSAAARQQLERRQPNS
jgi:hypothetical protein